MRDAFKRIAQATASLPHPRTFYELDATKEIYGPADDSFIAEMITLAGGTPITTGSPTVFSIPLEKLVAADPEVIVLGDSAYGTTPEVVASRPGWDTMTAVKDDAIRPIDDTVVTRPGPRLVEGLRNLALAIHPDLVLPARRRPRRPAPRPVVVAPGGVGCAVGRVAVGLGLRLAHHGRSLGADRVVGSGRAPAALRTRRAVAFAAAFALLAARPVLGVGLGTVSIAPADTLAILARRVLGLPIAATWTPATEAIVMDLRLPRVLAAMVGRAWRWPSPARRSRACCATRSPIPYVLGTASGAALGRGDRRADPRPDRALRVRAAPRPRLRGRADRGLRRLPPVAASAAWRR